MPRPFPWSAALSLPLRALATARGAGIRQTYLSEAKAEPAKPARFDASPMDERAIAWLPEPLRRSFARCGFLGRPAMRNVRLTWAEYDVEEP